MLPQAPLQLQAGSTWHTALPMTARHHHQQQQASPPLLQEQVQLSPLGGCCAEAQELLALASTRASPALEAALRRELLAHIKMRAAVAAAAGQRFAVADVVREQLPAMRARISSALSTTADNMDYETGMALSGVGKGCSAPAWRASATAPLPKVTFTGALVGSTMGTTSPLQRDVCCHHEIVTACRIAVQQSSHDDDHSRMAAEAAAAAQCQSHMLGTTQASAVEAALDAALRDELPALLAPLQAGWPLPTLGRSSTLQLEQLLSAELLQSVELPAAPLPQRPTAALPAPGGGGGSGCMFDPPGTPLSSLDERSISTALELVLREELAAAAGSAQLQRAIDGSFMH